MSDAAHRARHLIAAQVRGWFDAEGETEEMLVDRLVGLLDVAGWRFRLPGSSVFDLQFPDQADRMECDATELVWALRDRPGGPADERKGEDQ